MKTQITLSITIETKKLLEKVKKKDNKFNASKFFENKFLEDYAS